jgi:beta-lactamase superfamily II metal-dependent hydrolase
MKLTIFQSNKGDCLLLTSNDDRRMLIDGGMRDSYREHVAPALGELQEQGKKLDLVYLSHIDQDHIAGVLQLMDDIVAWRVHAFQISHGNPTHKPPTAKRPPEVEKVWHNAFHEVITENTGAIEDLLAATAAVLSGAQEPQLRDVAAIHDNIVNGVGQAIQLSRRIGDQQLGIPLNPEFDHKLMIRDRQPEIKLGAMALFILGPTQDTLDKLRKEWNAWLADNQQQLKDIQVRASADAARLATNEAERLLLSTQLQAEELGRRENVTAPNLASLMILVDEAGKTVLLTGDGHHQDILDGLKQLDKLNGDGTIHLNVLKVQHHGSENNLDENFCQRVTADHYVFCGNGAHANPNLTVVQTIVDSRKNDQRNFKLWFNSRASVADVPANKKHMQRVEDLVAGLAGTVGGRMEFVFLEESQFAIIV